MNLRALAPGAAAIAIAACLSVPATHASAETLRWLTWKTENAGDAMAENIKWFRDQFNERADGQHEIKVMWGGAAASQREIPDAISAGVGAMGDIVLPYYMDKFLLNNAAGYFTPQPMSAAKLGDAMERWHETYPQFDEELARYNLKAIGYRPLEDYGLLCTSPVRTIEDFKGKRIRSYGSAYPALFEALGATPISISTTEAYEALERGIIDCTPTGINYADSFKYDEVAKYYSTVPFGSNYGQFVVMNLDEYNGLDDETKAVLDDLGKQNTANFVGFLSPIADRILEGWKEKGVEYIEFPQDAFAGVIENEKIQALRQQWVDRATAAGVPGEKIADELKF